MALPVELRERAVGAYLNGEGSRNTISRLFGIGTATLGRWVRRKRDIGVVACKPHGGGQVPRIGPVGELILYALVEQCPDGTLEELTDAYAAVTHMPMNDSVVSRVLIRLGLTRKKRLSLHKSDRASACKPNATSSCRSSAS